MNGIEYIKSRLTKPEILAALAEECSELAQAALKLRRVLDGSNPTPVSKEGATENLLEEFGDVITCAEFVLTNDQIDSAMEMSQAKISRWEKRLKKAEASSVGIKA